MSTTTPSTRTITLTGRAPVTIREDLWPVIATGKAHDGREYESQANRRAQMRVRQHADGRAIVYGTYSTNWQGERDKALGELIPAGEHVWAAIEAAIKRVGAELWDDRLAQDCLADLPAVDLDDARPAVPVGDISYAVAAAVDPDRYTGRVYCGGRLMCETATVGSADEAWALLHNPEAQGTQANDSAPMWRLTDAGRAALRAFLTEHLRNPDAMNLGAWEDDVSFDGCQDAAGHVAGHLEVGSQYTRTGNPVTRMFAGDEITADA